MKYCQLCGWKRDNSDIVTLTYRGKRIRVCKDCFNVHIDQKLFQMTFEIWEAELIAKTPDIEYALSS